jgi:hypothetical protein
MMRAFHALILIFLTAAGLPAQSATSPPDSEESRTAEETEGKIQDNLFLMEEAYNQEPGVIQHIQSFLFDPESDDWDYTFTEEWPVPTDLHQLSITVPVSRRAADDFASAGDILLNYRYQAARYAPGRSVAFAPRFSLVLPTGSYREGTGRGVPGYQLGFPVSIELGSRFVTHLNAGFTVTPGAKSPAARHEETSFDTNAGLAVVWLPREWANGLIEFVHTSTEEIRDDGTAARTTEFTVNPGIRLALTLSSGLQIVPGLSVPVSFEEGESTVSLLTYLSLEHPLWTPGK